MTRSRTSRSTGPATKGPDRAPEVDIYLLPAIVGGGVGDIDEVLCAGRRLASAGFALTLYRRADRPLPRGVDGPWLWPPHRRVGSLVRRAARALTVAPAWGITAATPRAGPLGRPGPWTEETAEIEQAYGSERTAHVSLEEFARTLTPDEETAERFREGGVRSRAIRGRLAAARLRGEVTAFREAFRTFRAFDRPNVLGVFATFRYDRSFAKEFPEAVQTGPLWPCHGPSASVTQDAPPWVWYASPASAETIAPAVLAGLRRVDPSPPLIVRTPRPWTTVAPGAGLTIRTRPWTPAVWRRAFRRAPLRIVTGSRSLLEALEAGGPFLYFNGVLGAGSQRRRHRPEKIVAFLALAREADWPPHLLADLADFSRGRRVADVAARAARGTGAWRRFPSVPSPSSFATGFEDAGKVLVRFARALARTRVPASELVARFRRASHP